MIKEIMTKLGEAGIPVYQDGDGVVVNGLTHIYVDHSGIIISRKGHYEAGDDLCIYPKDSEDGSITVALLGLNGNIIAKAIFTQDSQDSFVTT